MGSIFEELNKLADVEYAAFSAKLAPTIDPSRCLGVRVPQLRALEKAFEKTEEMEIFINSLPHKYYDENMLHSIYVSRVKDFDTCISLVNEFLPYVDNWAACDTLRPKVFEKHRRELMPYILNWINSNETYTCRFGIDMLMTFYLGEDFEESQLELVAGVKSDEYYVNMMIAWYFATALAKQWETTIPYVEQHRLEKWTHNKTIQKAKESYRITKEQKEYLNSFRDSSK